MVAKTNLAAIVTLSMDEDFTNFDSFTTCSQSILHAFPAGIHGKTE